jgi:hypothetical protein
MADDIDRYADAISRIESGGRYDLTGPTHPRMGRALGRYQVMETNLQPWLREAGLPQMTAEQFLASPQAQDAVFRHRFGGYVQRYGPEGAAQAWFAGPGSIGAPGAENRRDSLGTRVADYVQRFSQGVGGMAPTAPATAPAAAAAPAAAQAPSVDAIASDYMRQNSSSQAQAYANAAATPDAPMQLPAVRLPSMAPRRVDLAQLNAALRGRIGV